MKVMRCSECKELFEAHTLAHVEEAVSNWSDRHLYLCPLCKLRTAQRGVSTIGPAKEPERLGGQG